MSSFDRTASPILTMPPQSAHQSVLGRPFFGHPSSTFGSSTAWTHNLVPYGTPAPRGRKRSRDEAAVNLDPPEKAPPAVVPVKEDEDEWEYGPGMILIKKKTGYVHDASNQSGTWLEEKTAKEEEVLHDEAVLAQQRQAQERPSLRSHKSSRLDLSATVDTQGSQTRNGSPGTFNGRGRTPDASGAQPVIDDFTLHLGIGWNRLGEHIQPAARGWARYIENHYPVTEPQILLESKGLESYLVEAREGFFLFAENLRQGRLVSSDAHQALNNLKCSPPVFDGDHTMTAAESPRPTEPECMAAAHVTTSTATDADMDMN